MNRLGLLGNADSKLHSAALPMEVLKPLLNGMPVMLIDAQAKPGQFSGIIIAIAALASSELTNLMAREGRSILSVTVGPQDALLLGLTGRFSGRTAPSRRFMHSVEAAACDGTGISAADRALTMRALGSPGASASDIVCPGHIAPLLVMTSDSHSLTGRAHAIVRQAGRISGAGYASAAWCDVLDPIGNVASKDYCAELAERLSMPAFVQNNGARRLAANSPAVEATVAPIDFGIRQSA